MAQTNSHSARRNDGFPNYNRNNLNRMTASISNGVRHELKAERINPKRIHACRPAFVPICASKDARVLQTSPNRQKALSCEQAKSSEVTQNQQLTVMIRIPSLAPFFCTSSPPLKHQQKKGFSSLVRLAHRFLQPANSRFMPNLPWRKSWA